MTKNLIRTEISSHFCSNEFDLNQFIIIEYILILKSILLFFQLIVQKCSIFFFLQKSNQIVKFVHRKKVKKTHGHHNSSLF